MLARSVVTCIGENKQEHCGYCNHRDPSSASYSFGIWSYVLDVEHYNDLLDRGMRRSGKYLYKPIIAKTCCPQYTIRLNVAKFHISKPQRKVLRQMNGFLIKDKKPTLIVEDMVQKADNQKDGKNSSGTLINRNLRNVDDETAVTSNVVLREEGAEIPGSDVTGNKKLPVKKKSSNKEEMEGKVDSKNSLQRQSKKKEIRKQKALEKMRSKGIDIEEAFRLRAEKEARREKTLDTYINEYYNQKETALHKLEVELVLVKSSKFVETEHEAFNLFYKYQTTVHLETSCTKEGFDNFLCNSPLQSALCGNSVSRLIIIKRKPFGSYHMQYRLDGKLIAVGVIDILPRCVSSKYFFYDPDYKFLSMGTYSALREIYLTKTLSRKNPGLDYYYMGYYIESCPKMRYKSHFHPSDLLCDTSFTWVPFDECKKQLTKSDRVIAFAKNVPSASKVSYGSMLCMYNRKLGRYCQLPREPEVVEMKYQVKEYANIVGPVGQEMVLFLK
uniref:Arginyl-tRNA--protein transferase 1 n=1 Tax=Syphacia muris TaxID=451379 RepID=A0A0N5AU24_9BILA